MNCLSPSIMSSSFKMRSWQKFNLAKEQIIQSVNTIVHHQALTSFIVLHVMEELINSSIRVTSSTPLSSDVSDSDREIIAYISGFVLFRCKSLFANHPSSLCIVDCFVDSEFTGSFNKLIDLKNRGGLCLPTDNAVNFFCKCESVFRQSFKPTGINTLNEFIKSVCEMQDIISLFITCITQEDFVSDTSDTVLQESMLLSFLKIFFNVRTHAKCKKLMEMYYLTTNTTKKQKPLRTSIS